ncbi:unnamed protein product [Pipistrellus nathusii]|uniref:Somatostatin/Cortistatin C-terminal domain-containing protein n=1 Tax=Pipistrellus nathusii TaxID=59473 RepID=A0ABN9ZQN5_PIPNA
MPPPLCLLLLLLPLPLPAASEALPPEGGLAGHHSDSGPPQEVADMKSGLLTFLAWWSAGTAQARAAPFLGGAAGAVSWRQEGPPPRQAPRPEPVPCRNFFWKTFSSCK